MDFNNNVTIGSLSIANVPCLCRCEWGKLGVGILDSVPLLQFFYKPKLF